MIRGVLIMLCFAMPAHGLCWYGWDACYATKTATRTPTKTATPTATSTATPAPALPAEWSHAVLCDNAVRLSAIPEAALALLEVLSCLTANDPDGWVWTDTISDSARIAYLPPRECPQWNPPNLCCTDDANNWCGGTCDGIYQCDKGSGLGPCRIAGESWWGCEWSTDAAHAVIILPWACSDVAQVVPQKSALKYELINVLNAVRGQNYDRQSWWGWRCS